MENKRNLYNLDIEDVVGVMCGVEVKEEIVVCEREWVWWKCCSRSSVSYSTGGICTLPNWLTANRRPVDAGCVCLRSRSGGSSSVGIVIIRCKL